MENRPLFQEDIYAVEESVTLVIREAWSDLSADSRTMLQNLTQAIKQKPAPGIRHISENELISGQNLPKKMVLFGHQVGALKLHLPAPLGNSVATLTLDTDSLLNDPDRKKELWGAIQLMIAQQA